MKLAKIRLTDGTPRLAAVEDNDRRLRLLDLDQVEKIKSLTDILHSPDPLGLARFLIDPKSRRRSTSTKRPCWHPSTIRKCGRPA